MATLFVVATFSLVGCSTSNPEAAEPTASISEVAEPTATTAQETCAQVGDAETVMFNAELAYRAGRSSLHEVEGAWRLTQRMFSRVDVEPGTPLAEAVDDMKSTLDVVPIGAQNNAAYVPGESGVDTTDISDACVEAGASPGIEAWTGG